MQQPISCASILCLLLAVQKGTPDSAGWGLQDAWLRQTVETCRQAGYVQTLGGRRRYLPDIAARARTDSAAAERQAVNTVCQVSVPRTDNNNIPYKLLF